MATKSIAWNTGSGNITVDYGGSGNGSISVQTDSNLTWGRRSQTVSVQTTDGQVTRQITVSQAGHPSKDYTYTGAVQSDTLPAGTYKLECWGAQGGSYSTTYYGGKGGYSVGEITLEQDTTIYVYVGGQGTGGTSSGSKAAGFNGGGAGYSTSTTYLTGSGGGASDVRIGTDSLYARVIVAGGGGGFGSYNSTASNRKVGGYGGGTSGGTGGQYSTSYKAGTGGTQTAKGTSYYSSTANSTTYGTLPAFGTGGASKNTSYQIAGGGGGWYGGGYAGRGGGAGGGSGYVYNSSSKSSYPSGCLLNDSYLLANAETKAGNVSMPSTSGSTETGHEGNGYIRITNITQYTVTIRLKDSQGMGMSDVEITVTSSSGSQTVTTDSNGEATFQASVGTCTLGCNDYLLSVTQFDVFDNTTLDVVAAKGSLTNAVVTVSNQTYSGSALTPAPTVTLNGVTVPSTGYNVSYGNNTNAGTATITVTGKNQYEGTASGTFTINKANPTYTAPAARSIEYTGSSQYLTTTGSTSHGTIQYSEDGSSWSTTRVSKTTIGTYTTYWRLIGDSNHNDVASTSITTTIAKVSRTLSFADTYAVVAPSGTVTKTATASAGGGTITYTISSTTYATINSSSGKVTAKTSDGSAVVTATISEDSTYQSASASYNLYVFATTHDYSYSGSYSSVTLPPGTYQFQCWGAQGGSNGTNSSYGITAQAGGKGGYSVGQLTVSQATGVRVYVGGAGSSTSGGYNGGGSTTGTSQYNASNELGYSKMGGGGGATDIRLSDGSLYSRMIVAGGGSGGAMNYKAVTTTTTTWENVTYYADMSEMPHANATSSTWYVPLIYFEVGKTYKVYGPSEVYVINAEYYNNNTFIKGISYNTQTVTFTVDSTYYNQSNRIAFSIGTTVDATTVHGTVYIDEQVTTSSTSTNTSSHAGYVGGGTEGGGYSSDYTGKQNSAGSGASFGQGTSINTTVARYCAGAGGGGWYGGGSFVGNNSVQNVTPLSGGGSGWVNTSASAGNRPSGFSSLQLDSGSTTAGNSSFPAPGGGNETGHAGNGYARITRL